MSGLTTPGIGGGGELSHLDDAVRQIAALPVPLGPTWHDALHRWPHPDVRRAWAQRPDAPTTLLEATADSDPDPAVAAATIGNPALPLPAARAHAHRRGETARLHLACRPDVPDDEAARLLRGNLSDTTAAVLSTPAAAGLAGKPTAQLFALTHVLGTRQQVAHPLLRVLEPHLADRYLSLRLDARVVTTREVRALASALPGTPTQRQRIRKWIDDLPTRDGFQITSLTAVVREQLPWWCDPGPITDADQATALLPLLGDVAARCPDRQLRHLAATALPHGPDLLDCFAANPAVDDTELTTLAGQLDTGVLQQGLREGGLREPRARLLLWTRLEQAGEPRPDPTGWDIRSALAWPELLPDVLEPYLRTAAWPVLDAAVTAAIAAAGPAVDPTGDTRLGQLLDVAAAVTAPAGT